MPAAAGQLDAYLGQLGIDHGVLAICDRRARPAGAAAEDAPPLITFEPARTAGGRDITVLRA